MSETGIFNQERASELGQAIAAQRESAEKTVVKTAGLLGVSPDEYMQLERGEKSPSLPQIEALALIFKVPPTAILAPSTVALKPRIDLSNIPSFVILRDKIISALLKKARMDNGISIDDLAQVSGVTAELIDSFEMDQSQVPMPTLEALCSALDMKIETLFSSISAQPAVEVQPVSAQPIQTLENIPDDLVTFFQDQNNLPYLELARKLSSLDAGRIREIAESLLEITY